MEAMEACFAAIMALLRVLERNLKGKLLLGILTELKHQATSIMDTAEMECKKNKLYERCLTHHVVVSIVFNSYEPLTASHKIHLIRLLRNHQDIGLKAAKDLVDLVFDTNEANNPGYRKYELGESVYLLENMPLYKALAMAVEAEKTDLPFHFNIEVNKEMDPVIPRFI